MDGYVIVCIIYTDLCQAQTSSDIWKYTPRKTYWNGWKNNRYFDIKSVYHHFYVNLNSNAASQKAISTKLIVVAEDVFIHCYYHRIYNPKVHTIGILSGPICVCTRQYEWNEEKLNSFYSVEKGMQNNSNLRKKWKLSQLAMFLSVLYNCWERFLRQFLREERGNQMWNC